MISTPRGVLLPAASLVFGALLASAVVLLAGSGDEQAAATVGVAGQALAFAAGGALLAVRWWRSRPREAWQGHGSAMLLLLGAGQAMIAVRLAGWSAAAGIPITVVALTDVLGVLAVGPALALVLTVPVPGVPAKRRLAIAPDVALVGTTAALLLWRSVFAGRFEGTPEALGALLLVLAYAVGFGLLLQLAALRPARGTLLFLGGTALASAGDIRVLSDGLGGGQEWSVLGMVGMCLGWPLTVAGVLLLPGREEAVDDADRFRLLERARAVSTAVALVLTATVLVTSGGVPLDDVTAVLGVAVIGLWGVRLVVDVVDRRALVDLLAHRADHDPLTGLGNRRALGRDLAARGRGPVGVALLDLDGFKQVNDQLGHTTGDELLVAVARALDAACPSGARAFRLGGDEFAVVAPWTGERLAATAELLVAAVRPAAAGVPGVDQVHLSASCGTAVAGAGRADELADVVGRADLAMQAAKLAGRDRVVADGGAPAPGHRRAADQLADDLAAGLLELRLVPVVGLAGGPPVALEAAPRWTDPAGRVREAAELAALGAASGLGPRLLAVVLRDGVRAVRRCAEPDGSGGAVPLVVPVTAVVLRSPGLAASVAAVLAAEGFPASSLVLEAPHDVITAWDDPAVHCLVDLARAGVQLSVDLGEDAAATHPLLGLPLRRLRVAVPPLPGRTPAAQAALARLAALARGRGADLLVAGVDDAQLVPALRAAGAVQASGPLWPAVRQGGGTAPGTTPSERSVVDAPR